MCDGASVGLELLPHGVGDALQKGMPVRVSCTPMGSQRQCAPNCKAMAVKCCVDTAPDER